MSEIIPFHTKDSKTIEPTQKDFRDLSTTEIEQLMKEGVEQARRRMHNKGISTIIATDDNIYEEHPDGSLRLLHERQTR